MKVKLSLFNVKLLIHIITFLLCVFTYANSKYANFFYAFILFETLFLVITQRNFSDIKKAFKNIIIILLFYLVFFIVSILFNEFKVNSIKAGISILLTPAIIFNAVIFYNELTMKDVVKIRKIYFVFILASVLFGIFEFITKKNFLVPYFDHNYLTNTVPYRSGSFFKHPITFSIVLGVAFCLLLGRNHTFIFKSLIIIALLMTRTRSSLIGLAVVLFFWLIKNIGFNIKKRTLLLVLLIALFIISPLGLNIISMVVERFSGSIDSISGSQRLGTINYVVKRVFNFGSNPLSEFFRCLFGHGVDSVRQLMLHTRIVIPGFDTTDNYYVTMLYNYGLFGLTGMILSIIWVVKNFFKSRSISEENLFAALIFFAIVGFFCELLEAKLHVYIIAQLLGIIFMQNNYNINKEDTQWEKA